MNLKKEKWLGIKIIPSKGGFNDDELKTLWRGEVKKEKWGKEKWRWKKY